MEENSFVSVLADRYASKEMRQLFAPEEKIIAERESYGSQLPVHNQSSATPFLRPFLQIMKRF